MSDYRLAPRPALAARPSVISPAITLEPLPEGHVIQVFAAPGTSDITPFLRSVAPQPHAVRTAAPGQWFIVGDSGMAHAEMTALFEALRPQAFAVDQSHGRVRVRAHGPMVERMLAKGTAVDLALSAFPVGHSATTLIGHISAHVTRTDSDTFEIMALRGFAENLWDDLARMSAEFF